MFPCIVHSRSNCTTCSPLLPCLINWFANIAMEYYVNRFSIFLAVIPRNSQGIFIRFVLLKLVTFHLIISLQWRKYSHFEGLYEPNIPDPKCEIEKLLYKKKWQTRTSHRIISEWPVVVGVTRNRYQCGLIMNKVLKVTNKPSCTRVAQHCQTYSFPNNFYKITSTKPIWFEIMKISVKRQWCLNSELSW